VERLPNFALLTRMTRGGTAGLLFAGGGVQRG
jgi:hypothetical protein